MTSGVRFGALLAVTAAVVGAAVWLMHGSPDAVAGSLSAGEASAAASEGGTRAEEVVIERGLSGEAIASLLVERGLIEDARRFNLLLGYSGASAELQSGCYEFAPASPAAEVIRRLRAGETSQRVFTVPEGLRVEEVGERAVEDGLLSAEQWETALAAVQAEALPPGRPAEVSLEGYLLPAAYPIGCGSTPAGLVRAMVEAFSEQVTPALVEELEAQGLTLHTVLTLASIVEREAVVKEERPLIASVFRNRVEQEIVLAADPTVQYGIATPESVAAYGWWKQELTVDDLASESPYNTYVWGGLPPGPIANPGLDAIVATIRPAETDYLFFVARGDGTHAFAETFAEHEANVQRYILDGGG